MLKGFCRETGSLNSDGFAAAVFSFNRDIGIYYFNLSNPFNPVNPGSNLCDFVINHTKNFNLKLST